MQELSLSSQIGLYVLLALIGLLALIVWGWQIVVLRGKSMKNADGSTDDWHEQKIFYGMAVVLVFVSPRWGYYLLAWISFWFVWANIMTTATSLRFEKPRITLNWFIQFPFGSIVGLAYIVWTIVHFDIIYFP